MGVNSASGTQILYLRYLGRIPYRSDLGLLLGGALVLGMARLIASFAEVFVSTFTVGELATRGAVEVVADFGLAWVGLVCLVLTTFALGPARVVLNSVSSDNGGIKAGETVVVGE